MGCPTCPPAFPYNAGTVPCMIESSSTGSYAWPCEANGQCCGEWAGCEPATEQCVACSNTPPGGVPPGGILSGQYLLCTGGSSGDSSELLIGGLALAAVVTGIVVSRRGRTSRQRRR